MISLRMTWQPFLSQSESILLRESGLTHFYHIAPNPGFDRKGAQAYMDSAERSGSFSNCGLNSCPAATTRSGNPSRDTRHQGPIIGTDPWPHLPCPGLWRCASVWDSLSLNATCSLTIWTTACLSTSAEGWACNIEAYHPSARSSPYRLCQWEASYRY